MTLSLSLFVSRKILNPLPKCFPCIACHTPCSLRALARNIRKQVTGASGRRWNKVEKKKERKAGKKESGKKIRQDSLFCGQSSVEAPVEFQLDCPFGVYKRPQGGMDRKARVRECSRFAKPREKVTGIQGPSLSKLVEGKLAQDLSKFNFEIFKSL